MLSVVTSSMELDNSIDADADLNLSDAELSEARRFRTTTRWTTTSTNGSGLKQGDPTTLTWSFPADGTVTDDIEPENPDSPNVLRNFLDTQFGNGGGGSDLTTRPWFSIFDDSFKRLEALSGLTFSYLAADDGVAMRQNNAGILNTRADMRIMGKHVDGQSGSSTLAYNFFPVEGGDMIIDTDDINYFTDASNNRRPFKNVLMHETGHGLGLLHSESTTDNFLMAATANDVYDGPQLDDILALQRHYGDVHEKAGGNVFGSAHSFGTVSPGQSASIGTLGDATLVTLPQSDFVSIDDETDVDFYKFNVTAIGTFSITLTPRGKTYNTSVTSTTQGSFNSKNQNDLTLTLLGADGTTVLQTRNVGGLGVAETITDFAVGAPGTFFVKVSGATADKVQLYGLSIDVAAINGGQILGTVFDDVDGDGTQDPGEAGRSGATVYIDDNDNGILDKTADVDETSTQTDANGNYQFTGLDPRQYQIRDILPDIRERTVPLSGLNSIDLAPDEVKTDVDFGSKLKQIGTGGNDAIVLNYSGSGIGITRSTNGGAVVNLGTWPLNTPLTIGGGAGTDSLRIQGTTGADSWNASATELNFNGTVLTLTSIEARTVAGLAGNDFYSFDADVAISGTYLLEESGTGFDTIDFDDTTSTADAAGLTLDLSLATEQIVRAGFLKLMLNSGSVFDNIIGGAGPDKLSGNSKSNLLFGGDGADDLTGRGGNDILQGDLKSDLYIFDADTSLGTDTLLEDPSGGFDKLTFESTALAVNVNLGLTTEQIINTNLRLILSADNTFEDIEGGSGNDSLTGNSQANFFDGFGGNDVLIGLLGNDQLTGGPGNDRYVFDTDQVQHEDRIVEVVNGGIDTLDYSASTLAATVDLSSIAQQTINARQKLTLTAGNVIENVIGSSGNDRLTGNSLNNILEGRAGGDVYVFDADSNLGFDRIVELTTPDAGMDQLDYSSTTAGITMSLASNTVRIVNANHRLQLNDIAVIEDMVGGSGNDVLAGNSLANQLAGNGGNDTLTGAAGNDSLGGGTGDDVYVFDADSTLGSDTIQELNSQGNDTLDFNQTSANVTVNLSLISQQDVNGSLQLSVLIPTNLENAIGGSGNDTLTGNSVANVLVGNGGTDTLLGGDGRDVLIGGLGVDTLNGGAQDDILSGSTLTGQITVLIQIRDDWNSTQAYAERVQAVLARALQNGVSVTGQSGAIDTMTGGTSLDLFFKDLDDVITDLFANGGEQVISV